MFLNVAFYAQASSLQLNLAPVNLDSKQLFVLFFAHIRHHDMPQRARAVYRGDGDHHALGAGGS